MKKRKVLSLLLAVALFASSVCTGYAAEPGPNDAAIDLESLQEVETKVTPLGAADMTEDLTADDAEAGEQNLFDEEEMVPVIIVFEAESIIEGNADAVMNLVNELKISFMEAKQETVIKKIEKKVLDGEDLDIHYQYTWLVNGIATEVPYGMVEQIESIKGVDEVVIQSTYETCSQAGLSLDGGTAEAIGTYGYTGNGTKIAVIDTGIDERHQNFEELDGSKLTQDSATMDSVGQVVEQLNAYRKYEEMRGEKLLAKDVYRSSKIPYGFNYVDSEIRIDHTDTGDDHGTHVAGIAAANDIGNGEMSGVAPDAQLYVMKVFGNNGGAYTEDLLAAVEDAMILDADVINMSLGNRAGFTSEGEYMDEVYGRVSETGTILAIAAGNDGTSGDGTNWSTGLSLSGNPDNGTIGSPGTYVNALTVANADCTQEETSVYFSSSWGPSPDLKLEPDIAAPGADIYSTMDNGTYGIQSGTSMATPYVAGAAALMVQQMQEKTAEERYTMINSMLMSTAEPIPCGELYWSPRGQGSGLVNINSVLESKAFLTVPGMDVPKVELRDDPEKTGNYAYEFTVHNTGDAAAYYEVETVVQTEKAKEINGRWFMSEEPYALEAKVQTESDALVKTLDYTEDGITCTKDARHLYMKLKNGEITDAEFCYDVDENAENNAADVQRYLDALTGKADVNLEEETLKVNPGEEVNISVSIDVLEAGKEYMDTYFENGIYVEGYTFLNGKTDDAVNLSLPYMGFYGDWSSAPILDDGYYWEDPETAGANYTFNEVYTQKDYYARWKLGVNPYLAEAFNEKYISISPNDDGYADYVDGMKLSLLRNAKELSVTFEDENGNEYYQQIEEKIRKANFNQYYECYLYYDMTDEEGEYLANNEKVFMNVELKLDYDQDEADVWTMPVTIDTEAPQALENEEQQDITVLTDGTKQYVRIKVRDNVGTAAICLLDEEEHVYTKYLSDHEAEENEEYQYFDITGIGDNFYVVLGDYAFNTSTYQIETTDNEYEVNGDTLYGYRIYDETSSVTDRYGWVDISKEDGTLKKVSSDYAANLTAADYIDGYVVGIDAENNLVAFEFGKWEERKQISWLYGEITDIAYDPMTEQIYAYDSSEACLMTLDPVTGESNVISNGFVEGIVAMACSDDGTLYAITRGGELKTINKEAGKLNEETLASTNLTPSKKQSMMYDEEQNCLYWASYEYDWTYDTSQSRFIKIDLANGYEMTELGNLGGNAQIVGLMKLDDNGAGLFDNIEINSIELEQSCYTLMAGSSKIVDFSLVPWCSAGENLEWVSQDPEIAEVTQDGEITAIKSGETTIQIMENGRVLAECYVEVKELKTDLYGFGLTSESSNSSDGWIKVNAADKQIEVQYEDADNQTYIAAERVDDVIYAYNAENKLHKLNAENGGILQSFETSDDYDVVDMAYNYSTGKMYVIVQGAYTTNLAQVDLDTGEITVLLEGLVDEVDRAPIYGIAITTDGLIYLLSVAGGICLYDEEYDMIMQIGGMGDEFPNSLMSVSMTYDHENGGIYIAPQVYRKGIELWYYDTNSGLAVDLGMVNGLLQWNGLHTAYSKTNIIE